MTAQQLAQMLKKGLKNSNTLPFSAREKLQILRHHNALTQYNKYLFLRKEFFIAKLKVSALGDGVVIPFVELKQKTNHIVVRSNDLNGAVSNDIVLVKKTTYQNRKKKMRMGGIIIANLEHHTQNFLAVLTQNKKDGQLRGIELRIPRKTFHLKATQKSLATLPKNAVLQVCGGNIKEVLGTLEDPLLDEKIVLYAHNRAENFSRDVQEEIQKLPKKVYPAKNRIDLCHLPFCTIDPKDAKDHDDALYYDHKNALLYVAIADVSHYVPFNCSIDREARERGFSIYFPHKSIPMLPRELSENLCSLKERRKRLAMVWKIQLHKKSYEVLNAELFEAVIKVEQKLTYERVDKILQPHTATHRIKPSIADFLQKLFVVTEKLRQKRLQIGYDFETTEYCLALDSQEEIKEIYTATSSTPSHHLVEECMLLANKQSALRLSQEKDKIGIYRVHARPTQQKLTALFDSLYQLGLLKVCYRIRKKKDMEKEAFWEKVHKIITQAQYNAHKKGIKGDADSLIIPSFSQAKYSSTPLHHFGLGFDLYSHFTSPIRRYSDLVLHRLLKGHRWGNFSLLCSFINHKELEADRAEKDFNGRKIARLALRLVGESYEAVVRKDKSREAQIISPPLVGVRVLLHENATKGGLKVQITNADLISGKIYAKTLHATQAPEITSTNTQKKYQYV